MLRRHQILVVMTMFAILVMGCSSTQMGVRGNFNNPYQQGRYQFVNKLDNKLSKLNTDAELVSVYPGLYDIKVNLKVDPSELTRLIDSGFEDETAGVVAGFMIIIAAIVGDETTRVDWEFRNLIFNICGVEFAYILIAKCRYFMYWVKNKMIDTAVKKFSKNVVVYSKEPPQELSLRWKNKNLNNIELKFYYT